MEIALLGSILAFNCTVPQLKSLFITSLSIRAVHAIRAPAAQMPKPEKPEAGTVPLMPQAHR